MPSVVIRCPGAFSSLLRELVAEFTLTDNPANTTTSLLRSLCHTDDSIILGTWLQETDHKTIEDQVRAFHLCVFWHTFILIFCSSLFDYSYFSFMATCLNVAQYIGLKIKSLCVNTPCNFSSMLWLWASCSHASLFLFVTGKRLVMLNRRTAYC